LVFLKSNSIKKPIENSKPATPKIKKELVDEFKSSHINPTNIERLYNTIHINSEKKINIIKFVWLKRNPNSINQNIKFQ